MPRHMRRTSGSSTRDEPQQHRRPSVDTLTIALEWLVPGITMLHTQRSDRVHYARHMSRYSPHLAVTQR
jgi:hypothetical protein